MLKGINKTTTFAIRGFYFKARRPNNGDFPFNIGYNTEYDPEPMSLKSKAALLTRKSRLNKQFIRNYIDLLNAIKNQNYEAIE